ncbi:MAG: hypothetical protein AAB276_04145, partial [Pseudomonadota bacterium]
MLPKKGQETELIRFYLSFESFILHSSPPIVVTSYGSKEVFRRAVAGAVDIGRLSRRFRLVFLPEVKQAIEVCLLGLVSVHVLIVENLGLPRLQALVRQATDGTALSSITVSKNGMEMTNVPQETKVSEVISVCTRLYKILYDDCVHTIGAKSVMDLYKHEYGR